MNTSNWRVLEGFLLVDGRWVDLQQTPAAFAAFARSQFPEERLPSRSAR